jgi:outer membrane protein TolC
MISFIKHTIQKSVFPALLLLPVVLYSQEKKLITLEYCQQKAREVYPQLNDKNSIKNAADLRIKNIETAYLPQVSLNGQATYQSEVTHISLPPQFNISIPTASKDQYKITLDAQQMVYDGGLARYQKKLEQAGSDADIQQIETDILRIKESVNNTFFNILILDENYKLQKNVLEVLKDKEKMVSSMVKNGALTQSDANSIIAERLKTEQQIDELELSRSAAIRILNLLTNETFTDSTSLAPPQFNIPDTGTINRPELKSFELQENRLDAAASLSQAATMPKIYVFGQYGYGRPGLNMLSTEFGTFYMVGATLKWNFFDWGKSHREKQVYIIQKEMVSTKRDNFNKNLNIDIENKQAAIKKLEEALVRDNDIVELRKGITLSAQSQLANGVITSTDYINELNAETLAKINLETHKVLLLQAKAAYLLTYGNL